MDKRTFLAVVLSLAVLFVYQTFFVKPPVKNVQTPAAPQQQVTPPTAQTAPPAVQPAPAPGRMVAPASPAAAEKEVVVENPLYRAVFTSRGAALKSFQLKQYKTALEDEEDLVDIFLRLVGRGKEKPSNPAGPVEMVQVGQGMPRPLVFSFPDSTINVPGDASYEADRPALTLGGDAKPQTLTFSQTYPGEIKIEKIYTFHPGKFNFDLEVRVHNLSAAPLTQNGGLAWHQYVDPATPQDSYGHLGPISYINRQVDRPEVAKLEAVKIVGPNVSWGGFESKYFLAALIPQNPSLTHLSISKDRGNVVSVALTGPQNVIPPGQVGVYSYSLYLGPKDYDILKAQKIGLENAIDFGDWLKWLAIPLLICLKFLNGFVHNYGAAIIILTILIKLLFWPLGNKSYRSMKEMQKLQPMLEALREKYKDDKARLSQESMALYRTHKINPLGGCLPMLVQIPVFFGLYKALLYAIELRHSPFIWWIKDLSAKDPYYITPIVMGATMLIQQKMTPTGADPMQAKIMLLMPVIFTFMFLNFPSGLVIYWLFNNIISIGQQIYVNRHNK